MQSLLELIPMNAASNDLSAQTDEEMQKFVEMQEQFTGSMSPVYLNWQVLAAMFRHILEAH